MDDAEAGTGLVSFSVSRHYQSVAQHAFLLVEIEKMVMGVAFEIFGVQTNVEQRLSR